MHCIMRNYEWLIKEDEYELYAILDHHCNMSLEINSPFSSFWAINGMFIIIIIIISIIFSGKIDPQQFAGVGNHWWQSSTDSNNKMS